MRSTKQIVASQNIRRMCVQVDDPRLPQRFWDKVQIDTRSGCWMWTAYVNKDGYGSFGVKTGCVRRAHRHCYETLVGPIPKGLEPDHLCRRPPCVNPAHMEPVTHRVNMERSITATKHFCIHGHEFTDANTNWYEQDAYKHYWARRCVACKDIWNDERLVGNLTPAQHEAVREKDNARHAANPERDNAPRRVCNMTPAQHEARIAADRIRSNTPEKKAADHERYVIQRKTLNAAQIETINAAQRVSNMTPAQHEARKANDRKRGSRNKRVCDMTPSQHENTKANARAYNAANRDKINAAQRVGNKTPAQHEAANAYARNRNAYARARRDAARIQIGN